MIPSEWKGWLVRFLAGAAIGLAAKAMGWGLQDVPVASLLGLTSLSFVVAAVLFGWPGLAAMSLVHLVYEVRFWNLFEVAVGGFSYALAGGLAWWAFARIHALDRSLSDFRSFRWYVLVSGVGAVLSATVVSAASGSEDLLGAAGQWSRSTLVTVWLFGPPLLWLGKKGFGHRLQPVPGEEGSSAPGVPEPGRRSTVVVGIALIAVCTAAGHALNQRAPQLGSWTSLLYLIPVFWAARRYQLVGGIFAAAGAGAFYLAAQGLAAGRLSEIDGPAALEIYAQLLLFWVIGAGLGAACEREARLHDQLAESNRLLRGDLRRVVRALTGAVEAKDLYTEGHLRRVNTYALQVGARLGLEDKDLEWLQIAGALHDVGKIGIPGTILNKPGPLDAEERRIMQTHPRIGARILKGIEGFEAAAPMVLHHQERFDGSRDGEFPGYPAGLTGDAIPLGARIIAVVDCFDAMTTDRPYRRALEPSEAKSVLVGERGRQFDPEVVDAFLAVLEDLPWR